MHLCNIKKILKEIDLFHPVFIVVFGHLAIILLALPYLNKIGIYNFLKILLVVGIFLISFSLPFFVDIKLEINKNIIKNLSLLSFLILTGYGSFAITHSILFTFIYLIIIILIVKLFVKYQNSKFFNNLVFLGGVLSFILIVLKYKGIPLLNYNIRMAINSEPLRLISTGLLIYSGIENIFYFAVSFILLTLLGYKAGILMLTVSYIIYKYKNKINLKHLILIFLGLFLILNIVGFIVILNSNQHWKIGFLNLLCYRAYFDLTVFNKILDISSLFGLGYNIILTPNGERYIGQILFGYNHNITTLMFGSVFLDFGIFSFLFAIFLGYVSKYIYNGDKKLYAIYASILLTYCEVGINYGFLIVLLFLIYLNSLEVDFDGKVYNKNSERL